MIIGRLSYIFSFQLLFRIKNILQYMRLEQHSSRGTAPLRDILYYFVIMRNIFSVRNTWHWSLLTVPLALHMADSSTVSAAADGIPDANGSIVKEHMARKANWIAEENTLRQGVSDVPFQVRA